jgi:hypothetical protein
MMKKILSGATLVFIAFIGDFSVYIFGYFSVGELFASPQNEAFSQKVMSYVPEKFN